MRARSSAWPTVRLSELQASKRYALNGGPFGSKLVSSDYVPEGVPVIRGTNLPEHSRFSTSDLVFVSELKADELLPNNAHPGDLVFTQRGTLGQVGLIPRTSAFSRFVISQSQMKLTVDERKADAGFLYYYFRAPRTVKQIHNLAFSTGVPHINLDILRNFEVTLPPLPVQKRIRTFLSAYDDLIENNTRRIRILEEMAQAIYREWFVHFRFPGHKKVKLVPSPLGAIPEGWEAKKLGEVCDIVMGQSPKSEFYNEQGDGLPFHQGVTDFGLHFPEDRVYCTVQNRIAEAGDILFSVRAPVGRINVTLGRIVIGRGLCAIRNQKRNQVFTLHQLKERFAEEDTMGGGTIFKAVTKEEVHGIGFLQPSREILQSFEDRCHSMDRLIEFLTQKNTNLRTTRDLLLPKLISGEVDVSALNINVGEAAA